MASGDQFRPLALNLRYPAVSSIREAAALLEQEVKKSKPGDWIWGFGWDYGSLEECKANPARMPNRGDLDPVYPDNPVLFVDFSCHAVWANSKAMELSGVTKEAPDPDGGVVEREPGTREPAGLFKELPAGGADDEGRATYDSGGDQEGDHAGHGDARQRRDHQRY